MGCLVQVAYRPARRIACLPQTSEWSDNVGALIDKDRIKAVPAIVGWARAATCVPPGRPSCFGNPELGPPTHAPVVTANPTRTNSDNCSTAKPCAIITASLSSRLTHAGLQRPAAGAVSTMVLEDPSGAACIPGGVCPCGLSAGAPPEPVSRGPVRPWGCIGPSRGT